MSIKLKTLIVEDEIMARKSLEKLCQGLEGVELVSSFDNSEEAIEYIKQVEIDLILLDIEMPGMTGLELLQSIPYLPQIVFTTAHKEYAFDAFEYDVVDFLKKPVTQTRLAQAIQKVISRKQQLDAVALASEAKEIYIKEDGKLIRLPFDKILYFKNVGDYIRVITSEGKYIIYGSIKSLDERLNHPRFLKVHRSYIVNLDKIKDIQESTIIIDNSMIPISRSHVPILMRSINIL